MMSITAKSTERRVQFDVLPERLAEFDQLMTFCDLKTRRDLFDQAMTLFEWAVQEVRSGKEIASYQRSTDTIEVVRFPVLDNAARRAETHRAFTLIAQAHR
jgi:hypothetical protein